TDLVDGTNDVPVFYDVAASAVELLMLNHRADDARRLGERWLTREPGFRFGVDVHPVLDQWGRDSARALAFDRLRLFVALRHGDSVRSIATRLLAGDTGIARLTDLSFVGAAAAWRGDSAGAAAASAAIA